MKIMDANTKGAPLLFHFATLLAASLLSSIVWFNVLPDTLPTWPAYVISGLLGFFWKNVTHYGDER